MQGRRQPRRWRAKAAARQGGGAPRRRRAKAAARQAGGPAKRPRRGAGAGRHCDPPARRDRRGSPSATGPRAARRAPREPHLLRSQSLGRPARRRRARPRPPPRLLPLGPGWSAAKARRCCRQSCCRCHRCRGGAAAAPGRWSRTAWGRCRLAAAPARRRLSGCGAPAAASAPAPRAARAAPAAAGPRPPPRWRANSYSSVSMSHASSPRAAPLGRGGWDRRWVCLRGSAIQMTRIIRC
jgi:hypothetical protein